MRRGTWVVAVLALGLALSAPAAADVPSDPPPAASATGATGATTDSAPVAVRGTGVLRPVFLGLVAALFLVMGAMVGANDKLRGDKPASRR